VETQTAASLSFLGPAMDGMVNETLKAFHAVPRRGAEMGGVLLGRYEEDRIVIEDYAPVVCEHRWGPSYILSDTDLHGLEETLQRCAGRQSGPAAVGFCRSHTRAEPGLDDRDRELFERYFPDRSFPGGRAVFLLLKPDRRQRIAALYFVRSHGVVAQAAGPLPFPVEGSVALFPQAPTEAAAETPEPETAGPAQPVFANGDGNGDVSIHWPPPPPRTIPPPTRPRLTAPSLTIEEPSHSRGRWIGLVAVLCGAAGIFGFWSLDLGRKPAAPQPATPASPQAVVPPQPVQPATPIAPAQPVPAPKPSSPLPAIQNTLTEWGQALRSGDPKTIAAFYAPVVDSYFGEPNVSRTAVARSLARSAARFGATSVQYLSELHIQPLGDTRATATFHKRWRTSGRHVYAGETAERLTLAKTGDAWKIASEQETRVVWTRRER
jgi:ketosteroid isomerase-like protein